MKRIRFLSGFVTALLMTAALTTVLAGTSRASLLYTENFTFGAPGDSIDGQNGWTITGTSAANIISLSNPAQNLSYPGYPASGIGNSVLLATSGQDLNRPFTTQNSGSVYAAALINVTSAQTVGDYFFHLGQSSIGSTFVGRVFIKKDPSSSNFALGLNYSSSGTLTYTPFNYVLGTTYLIVVKHTIVAGASNDFVQLFVNPVVGGAEPVADLLVGDPGTDIASIGAVALRQGSAANAASVRVDGIRVGTTWADAVNAPTWTITSTQTSGGTIAPLGSTTVNDGSSQTYSIGPDPDHHIVDVKVDGVSQGAISSFTFSNVQANHTIDASFAIDTYTINSSASSGGIISPNGATTVNAGANQVYNFMPNPGHHVSDVVVDGGSVGTPGSYTFSNVHANHTISVVFALDTHTVTASAGANGSIAPPGVTTVNDGDNLTYTITPDGGYAVQDVTVDGVSVGAVTSYTFNNIQADHTIDAKFANNVFTITATAGSGGTINPSGAVSVTGGNSQTFVISPNDKCHVIADVLVDGVSVGPVSSYTFSNVHANHTIDASFSVLGPYTITATAGSGGTISPNGATTVACGGSQTYLISPADKCHTIADVLVDGVSVGPVSTYTLSDVQANHTIDASFGVLGPYTITASAGANGSIAPNGASTVACGGSQTYTITPNSGYHVNDVLVDGVSVGAVASYTFSDVQANHTIDASFAQNPYTITATAGPGGSIAPSGAVAVTAGNDQSFTITPNGGFLIQDVVVDGSSVGAVSSYTFTNVQADHTINATFAQPTYTLTVNTTGSGSVNYSPNQATYPAGTMVTITATPAAGNHLDSWSGDASGHVNPLVITMDANKTITANFLADIYAWNQSGTASFATSTNWTPERHTPKTDDVLEFNNGATTTATGVTTQTLAQILLSGGTNISLQSNAAVTLSLGGGAGTDLDVPSGNTLTLTAAAQLNAITINLASGVTSSIGGTVNVTGVVSGTNATNHRIQALSNGAIQVLGGGVVNVLSGFQGNLFGAGVSPSSLNSVVIQTGALYTQVSGSNPFGAAQPATVTTFQPGSRYRLDGPITPSFSGRTYADVEINTPGPTTVTGGATLTLDSLIVTQGVFNIGMTGQVNMKGSLITQPGTTLGFVATSGSPFYVLNGSAVQRFHVQGVTNGPTIAVIQLNNAAGVLLTNDVSLPLFVTFNTGKIVTGSHILKFTSAGGTNGASQASGWVVGNQQVNFPGGTTTKRLDVGDPATYAPAFVTVNGAGGPFDIEGNTTTGDHPQIASSNLDPNKSANRYWTLTPVGTYSGSTDVVFNFAASDVDGGADPNNFVVGQYDGATWNYPPVGTRTATSTQTTGLSSFGDFQLAEVVPPTATTMSMFQANPVDEGVELRWQFGDVTQVSAAYVERSNTVSGPWTRLTATPEVQNGVSVLVDRTTAADQTYEYRIVATIDGQSVSFPSVEAKAGAMITAFALSRVSPNPTTTVAHIEYAVPRAAHVQVSILDLQGRVVSNLVDGVQQAGRYTAIWSGDSPRGRVAAGMYFVRFNGGGVTAVKRIALTH